MINLGNAEVSPKCPKCGYSFSKGSLNDFSRGKVCPKCKTSVKVNFKDAQKDLDKAMDDLKRSFKFK